MRVWSSFLSLSLLVSLTKPFPAYPSTISCTLSTAVLIVIDSERAWSSLQILENSPELMVIKELYSVSGMERCSTSREIRFRENSVDLYVFGFSKISFNVLGS